MKLLDCQRECISGTASSTYKISYNICRIFGEQLGNIPTFNIPSTIFRNIPQISLGTFSESTGNISWKCSTNIPQRYICPVGRNSLLSDINDNCDNNEITKDSKNLVESISKHEWEYSRWEFSGWEFSDREFS